MAATVSQCPGLGGLKALQRAESSYVLSAVTGTHLRPLFRYPIGA